jgi:hypothetical protein
MKSFFLAIGKVWEKDDKQKLIVKIKRNSFFIVKGTGYGFKNTNFKNKKKP